MVQWVLVLKVQIQQVPALGWSLRREVPGDSPGQGWGPLQVMPRVLRCGSWMASRVPHTPSRPPPLCRQTLGKRRISFQRRLRCPLFPLGTSVLTRGLGPLRMVTPVFVLSTTTERRERENTPPPGCGGLIAQPQDGHFTAVHTDVLRTPGRQRNAYGAA